MTTAHPRVLFLTKYARNGASSRYRTFQYLPWFERAGMQCEVMPLFDAAYLVNLYQDGRRRIGDVARGFLRRLIAVARVRRFDLVVVEYEMLPYVPAFLERGLGWLGVPYVVDYDDALFHQYDEHRLRWVTRLLGQKIAHVMRGARLVTVGNAYLADYAQRAEARRIEIVPTVIDLDRYPASTRAQQPSATFTIGWIGSPSTAKYLTAIAPALADVCAASGGRVRLIGSGPIELPGVPVERLAWSDATEVELMQQLDVGIMPLPDAPWERGKCGFKLIQYMACGLPVVASPVGVNRDIVQPGVNGFLADTIDEWVRALRRLQHDAALRQQLGQAGRSKVEQEYCVQVTAPRLVSLYQSIIQAG